MKRGLQGFMKLSVVIPGFNVADTVGNVVKILKNSQYIGEVIVVDNNSTDSTYQEAGFSGAIVIKCTDQGLGYAMKSGIEIATNTWIMKIDGDIRNPNSEWVDLLLSGICDDKVFVNGIYESDYDEYPVGNLVAKPALKLNFPYLDYITMPLSGTYIFNRSYFTLSKLPNNWAFDLAMVIEAHHVSSRIGQVKIGELNDRQKKIIEYVDMAYEIMDFVFNGLP